MAGSPCGACKFLRRKCASECVFAPYFCSEQGPARFAAIHKVFGASNVGKLLQHLPVQDRCEAVVTISFEAQARVRDPVYGCVAHIFALQQQVAYLQAQVMQAKAQLENGVANNYRQTTHLDNHQWSNGNNNINNNINNNNLSGIELLANYNQVSYSNHPISPQSSLESIDQVGDANFAVKIEDKYNQDFGRMQKYTFDEDDDMGELQELALRMMGN